MTDPRVEQLVAAGEFAKAADLLDSRTNHSLRERVLRASIECHIGDVARAHATAKSLLAERLDASTRAIATAVVGRCVAVLECPERGLSILQRAIAIASHADAHLEADLRARYAQDVLSWIGVEPALAELPRLRHCALRSGNRHALTSYHIVRARVAALRGCFTAADEALRHAGELLDQSPHADTAWLLKHVRVGVSLMGGDLEAARTAVDEAIAIAITARTHVQAAHALGNKAYIYANAGNFSDAQTLIRKCLNRVRGPARLAALSTGIQIGLAVGDKTLANSMVEDGLTIIGAISGEWSYYRLWFELHRARWLISNGEISEAKQLADAAMEPASRLADAELWGLFSLVSAECFARAGDSHEASLRFGRASTGSNPPTLPYLIELHRVAAIVIGRQKPDEARKHLGCASRLANSSGWVGLLPAIDQASTLVPDSSQDSDASMLSLNEIDNILAVGRHPVLLGKEILHLLCRLSDSPPVWLLRESDGAFSTVTQGGTSTASRASVDFEYKIPLGRQQGASYCLAAQALPTPTDHSNWNCIRRIVAAAHALQGAATHNEEASPTVDAPESNAPDSGLIILAENSAELFATAKRLAPSNITVLITGETGTGKELLARALHDSSPRASKPFIPFNCSAVSREMLDAQLFGYRKGAFTGASDAFPGVIRAAAGGTLFLDEIGEVALDVQPKLLRFLESGEIHPLGEPRPIQVDVRVVAATNANLEAMVDEGRFREDLFYRLNVVRLEVPPLRERREEVPPLVQHYLDRSSRDAQKTGIRLADETMEYLILYDWPGNVRQLANEIRRMVALAESGAILMPEHLSHAIASSRRTIRATERYLAPTEFVVRVDQPLSAALEHVERSMIRYALKLSGGRLEDAAHRLGVSRKGLYLKRQRLGLDDVYVSDDHEDAEVPAAATESSSA